MPTMAERAAAAAAMEEEDNAPSLLASTSATAALAQRRMSSASVFEDSDTEAMSEHAGVEEEEIAEYGHMQEIVPGLWLGDIVAAMDEEALKESNITSIMSIIRQSIPAPPGVKQLPLPIDDGPSTDILTHLPSCAEWIQQAIEDGDGGVLVHCQAGMSRSATVVAAYLMRLLSISPEEAIEMIKEKRNFIQPSDTFMEQLYLYYAAHCRVSTRDRSTRQWYMERSAAQVMNGGQPPAMDKMAKYPATPTPSMPPTPAGGHGRRKIRCKMCRRQLATREHMMDHILDQNPLSRPRTPSTSLYLPSPLAPFPADGSSRGGPPSRQGSISRRPSSGLGNRPDVSLTRDAAATSMDKSRRASESSGTRRPSGSGSGSGAAADSLLNRRFVDAESLAARLPPHLAALRAGVPMPGSSMGGSMSTGSALGSPSPIDPDAPTFASPPPLASPGSIPPPAPSSQSRRSSMNDGTGCASISSALSMSSQRGDADGPPSRRNSVRAARLSMTADAAASARPSEGSKVAARKLSMMALTPSDPDGSGSSGSSGANGRPKMSLETDFPLGSLGSRRNSTVNSPSFPTTGPPILVNPKCSGYFVEPLTWMEPMLEAGEMQGKIMCPNEKCNAKIGNYDWAGVQCGCKEWVVPGFCISRSKVDEVW